MNAGLSGLTPGGVDHHMCSAIACSKQTILRIYQRDPFQILFYRLTCSCSSHCLPESTSQLSSVGHPLVEELFPTEFAQLKEMGFQPRRIRKALEIHGVTDSPENTCDLEVRSCYTGLFCNQLFSIRRTESNKPANLFWITLHNNVQLNIMLTAITFPHSLFTPVFLCGWLVEAMATTSR